MKLLTVNQLPAVNDIIDTFNVMYGSDVFPLISERDLANSVELAHLVPRHIVNVLAEYDIPVVLINGLNRIFPGNLTDGKPFIVLSVDVFDAEIKIDEVEVEIRQTATGRLKLQLPIATWDGVEFNFMEQIEDVKTAVANFNLNDFLTMTMKYPWCVEIYGRYAHMAYTNAVSVIDQTDDLLTKNTQRDALYATTMELISKYEVMKKTPGTEHLHMLDNRVLMLG